MRVVQANKYFWPPHLGGIEHSLLLLSRELARRDGVSCTAVVANEGRETVREQVEGVDVLRVARLFAAASTPVAPGFRSALRREATGAAAGPGVPPSAHAPADVIHMHSPYPWGELSWRYSGLRTPSVLTYHSDIVRQKLLGAAYAPFLRSTLTRVDRIIVGSPQMIDSSPFLAPHADKCRVVPFAIDVDRCVGDEDTVMRAAELRRGHERPIVLFVGRLVYYKGADVLVDAMRDVDADLVVIGRGPLEEELKSRVEAGGYADRVTWLAPVDEDELVAWYHAADVFALPSVAVSEAYGLVQLEAHAAGTPVVSTDLPTGVPFVNPDGITGLTVPAGDAPALAGALQKLADDEELRRRLGDQARVRVLADFTVDRMVDRVVDVYREAIEMRTGTGS